MTEAPALLPIYYINLAARPDRRRFMEDQLARLGLTGTRIEAVTPAGIPEEDAARYCDLGQPRFLRRNQLACTLSHERAWQAMITDGREAALILEDDAELSPLLPAFLGEAAGIDADLIRIETTGIATRVYPVIATGRSGVSLREFRSTTLGSAGYVLRAAAAKRMIAHPGLRQAPTDRALYNPFEQPGASISRVLTDPALCRQLGVVDQHAAPAGRSDMARDLETHEYAKRYPLHYLLHKLDTGLKRGTRNVLDHLAQRSRGLERRVIPFHQDG